MKKFFITAACIAVTLFSFANPATGKHKNRKEAAPTLNANVTTNGTKLMITAISDLPGFVDVTMQDDRGNDVYEGKLIKGEYTQSAVFNLEQLSEGTYSIVLQNGKDRFEKKIAVNTNTTKQLSVE